MEVLAHDAPLPVVQQPEAQPVNYSVATVQTVKDTIFKGANDAELQLYFHKCLSVGCHPLDGLIHPSKFKDGDTGQTRVVFITSIDLFRARAEETELYDGQDEPEFEFGEHGDDFEHPTFCRVNIYKKEISRPIVGTADWQEFYPALTKSGSEKKRFMWKKMPKVMLAKCAEAQGLRKAFPQQLNKLYAEEEMMQAIEGARDKSTKPQITQPTEPIESGAKPIQIAVIESVGLKSGSKNGKDWTKYSIGINGEKYGTFDKKIAEAAELYKKEKTSIGFGWGQSGQFKNITKLWEVKPEPDAPFVMPHEVFKKEINTMAKKAGIEDVNKFLKEQFKIEKLDDVTADKQSAVIDLFNFYLEEQNGTKQQQG